MNPLTSVKGSLITGFVIAILFAVFAVDGGWNELGLARWLHIIAGITWIGLLYYFNAVQVPALAEAAADKGGPGGAGITKYVAPRALLWFRWSAVVTWLTGAWYLARARATSPAPSRSARAATTFNGYQFVIGVGRLARHDHAVQRLGVHLAEPEEDPRHRAGNRRAEGRGAQDGALRLAHELHPLDPDAAVHGGRHARTALLGDCPLFA